MPKREMRLYQRNVAAGCLRLCLGINKYVLANNVGFAGLQFNLVLFWKTCQSHKRRLGGKKANYFWWQVKSSRRRGLTQISTPGVIDSAWSTPQCARAELDNAGGLRRRPLMSSLAGRFAIFQMQV